MAEDDLDDPPMSVVIDAALENLIEHEQNLDDTRGELPPETIQRFNTSVVGLRYRTSIESRYR
ncbi:hypothetical protein NP511_04295 [Natrinema thermotolerans]|uniref:Uncharacterized protein n=1 Tax=Natrinema thermotolerans TaxID=121872 RepID=A0AAF0PCV7_9EURY|nr:hypothetical protein [Natrinema thermotolerans]QCC57768.1 hypothetical protein DVR14_03570 [Natrinema thermotolerans]WMT08856.1 hypothetical protein NP511_04295 [Natrinema thermotolerans]